MDRPSTDPSFPVEPPSSANEGERQTFFEAVLVDYIMRAESGENPDIDGYLARYPRYAADLAFLLSQNTAPPQIRGVPQSSTRERLRGWSMRALGDYDILFKVSATGGGRVYKARHKHNGHLVALKVLATREAIDPREIERFKREARILRDLELPNVMTVLEVQESRDTVFMAMPWIDGGTIQETIAALRGTVRTTILDIAALTPKKRGKIIEDVARTMEAVHQKGILHRDLKPSNIMLSVDHRPMVIDFGIARAVDHSRLTNTHDAPLGTPRFLAPELLLGDAKAASAVTDVYALGMTLYEFLTLRPAFDGKDRQSLYEQILRAPVKSPAEIDPECPRALAECCLRAVAREPGKRWPSMSAFAAALESALSDSPSVATEQHDSPRRLSLIVVAILVVAALLAVGYVLVR